MITLLLPRLLDAKWAGESMYQFILLVGFYCQWLLLFFVLAYAFLWFLFCEEKANVNA